MPLNLVEAVKSIFSPELIAKVASSMGEKENNVQRAFNGAIPASLAGILNKVGNGGALGVLKLSSEAMHTGLLNNLDSLLSGSSTLLTMGSGLYGDKLGGVIRSIAGFAGIRDSSASAVLNMATPAALATVGKATDGASSPSTIISLLNSQKESILNAIPGGLNLAGALGLNSLSDITSNLSNVYSSIASGTKLAARRPGSKRKTSTGIWLLLIAAVAIGAWFLFGRNCKQSNSDAKTPLNDTIAGKKAPYNPNQLREFSIPT